MQFHVFSISLHRSDLPAPAPIIIRLWETRLAGVSPVKILPTFDKLLLKTIIRDIFIYFLKTHMNDLLWAPLLFGLAVLDRKQLMQVYAFKRFIHPPKINVFLKSIMDMRFVQVSPSSSSLCGWGGEVTLSCLV
jgi:hypothetical protein